MSNREKTIVYRHTSLRTVHKYTKVSPKVGLKVFQEIENECKNENKCTYKC